MGVFNEKGECMEFPLINSTYNRNDMYNKKSDISYVPIYWNTESIVHEMNAPPPPPLYIYIIFPNFHSEESLANHMINHMTSNDMIFNMHKIVLITFLFIYSSIILWAVHFELLQFSISGPYIRFAYLRYLLLQLKISLCWNLRGPGPGRSEMT